MIRLMAPASARNLHEAKIACTMHAHETLFVILEGEGEVLVGKIWGKVKKGDVAFVPRWIFHQTKNTSATDGMVVLAITDFGFTSAVLGDYDARTRLATKGPDAVDQ